MEENSLTPAFIYPLGDKSDVLNFFLYPDSGDISLGSGGGSQPHPSYGHSVKQLTGRLSPTFTFSLIFEGVSSELSDRAGSSAGSVSALDVANEGDVDNAAGNVANDAFRWFMRNVGPDGVGEYRDEAQQFVMKLWGAGSKLVSIDRAKLTPMVMSRLRGRENVIRRFRADVQGEYIYPVQVDQGLFKKKRKPAKRGGATEAKTPIPRLSTSSVKDDQGNYRPGIPQPVGVGGAFTRARAAAGITGGTVAGDSQVDTTRGTPALTYVRPTQRAPDDPGALSPAEIGQFVQKAFPPPPTARPHIASEVSFGESRTFSQAAPGTRAVEVTEKRMRNGSFGGLPDPRYVDAPTFSGLVAKKAY